MNITSLRYKLTGWLDPIVKVFVKTGMSPNQITLLSLFFGIGAAVCYFCQSFIVGSVLLLISGILDLTDGSVARITKKKSDFGAISDWIVDKYVDGIVLLAIGLSGVPIISQFVGFAPTADMLIAGLAVIGSIMNTFVKPVTYAEIGYTCKEDGKISDPLEGIGFFGRPETLSSLVLFGVIGQIWIAVILVAVCTNLSAFQRLWYLWRKHGEYKKD
jgi:archaetidylinositol phosphate synthase